ncbi:hypothetical protein JX265_002574 [Neoarthrinium moseri]|uniref:Uncharacterized protein n=1 Tax=Neoarthrinium moseri TaxID=1658444 RepID=A0A9P9WUP0_9PEZI|nr:hypothetical protein JX266_001053 [Neoarthrinium moseri]KAI1879620.1 hypothetical protein JX265_002574 [Neoarthrinium moseri]
MTIFWPFYGGHILTVKPATSVAKALFEGLNHIEIDLRDHDEICRVLSLLRDECSETVSLLENISQQFASLPERGLKWWDSVIAANERSWLNIHYSMKHKDTETSYKLQDPNQSASIRFWDAEDPWIKGTLSRMPQLKPVFVIAQEDAPSLARRREVIFDE